MNPPEHIILADGDLATADFSRVVGTNDPGKASYRYGVWMPTEENPGYVAITEWGNAMQVGSLLPELISAVAALERTPAGALMHLLGFSASYASTERMSSGKASLPYLVNNIPRLNLPPGVSLPMVEGSTSAVYSAREGVEAASRDTILIATEPDETGINIVDDRLNHFLARILMPESARSRLAEVAESSLAAPLPSGPTKDSPVNRCMQAIDTTINMGNFGFEAITKSYARLTATYRELLGIEYEQASSFAEQTFERLDLLGNVTAA